MTPNRYVILHHLSPAGEHWDFMLERDHGLLTWQMKSEPLSRDACPIQCLRIKDHRKAYLDYQGPVSGGRGIVTRVDRGTYELLGTDEESWTLRLQGTRLVGDFRLERPDPASRSRWTFIAI